MTSPKQSSVAGGRAVPEWIGKSPDVRIPERVRLRVYMKHNGRCPACTRKLEDWDCDHIVALANGGEHRESNLQPLCVSPCHSNKTRADVEEKSRTYRIRSKHVRVKRLRRTIPGRKFDGTPIPSRTVFR